MELKKLRSKKRHALLFILPFFLSACFGEKEKSTTTSPNPSISQPSIPKPLDPKPLDPTPSPAPDPSSPSIKPIEPNPSAPAPKPKNITRRVLISDETTHKVSLASSVEAQKDVTLSLVSVTPLSIDCPVPSEINATEMTYILVPDKSNICFYRYTVRNKALNGTQTEGSADQHILITDDINVKKEPLSLPHFNINTGNASIGIDVIAELIKKDVNLTGKILSDDILVFSGQKGISGGGATVTPQNTILFTPDGTSSFSRLIYTLLDPNNSQYVEAGSLDLFIEQENNTLPVAHDFIYPEPVKINEITSIDLAQHISDPDGDPVTLYSVFAFNAWTSLPKSDTSSCKTCFNFKANQQGQYKINYVITDQGEGFASAFVTINVSKPWKDVFLTSIEKNFSAMPDEIEAEKLQIIPSGFDDYPGNTDLKIPRLTFNAATAFCSQQGMRLSHQHELVKLYQQRGRNLYINDGWPVSSPYWVSTDTQEALSLENLKSFDSVQEAFFTCVNTDVIDVTILPLKVVLQSGKTVQLSVKTINETGSSGNALTPITWKSLDQRVATVDDNGLVTAISTGEVSISARVKNVISQKYAEISVFEISNVVLFPGEANVMLPNRTLQLSATPIYTNNYIPDTPSPITWRSSEPNLIEVDSNGLVRTRALGFSDIYAIVDGVASKNPVRIEVIANASEILGTKTNTSYFIDPRLYPIISFSGYLFFEGIFTENHGKLIVGSRGREQFPANMNIRNVRLLMGEKHAYGGRGGIALLEWAEIHQTRFLKAGLRNAATAPLGQQVPVTEHVKGLTVYLSDDKNGPRTITGFRVDYY